MKIKIIGILVSIMLMTTFLSVASDFEDMESENHSINEKVTSSFDDDIPVWNIGDKWTYKIHDINMDVEENETIHVHLEIDEFPLKVVGDSGDYNVEINNVKLKGNYHVIIEDENGTIDVEGQLIGTTFNGNIFFTKDTLGIKKIDYIISGILTVTFNELPEDWNIPNILKAIPIPATISTSLEFSTPYTFLDFPMNDTKLWGLPPTNFTVNGEIQSIWLVILNIINNIATAFNYPLLPENISALLPVIDIRDALETRGLGNVFDIPEVPSLFACFSKHSYSVLAGPFECYNISVAPINQTHALGRIYYSPEAKNIIKISGELGDLLPFMTNLEMELKEYQLV